MVTSTNRVAIRLTVVAAVLMIFGCATEPSKPPSPAPVFSPPSTLADCGIEMVSFRLTPDGGMVEFRFRVLDKKKAAPLLSPRIVPYGIHEASRKRLGIPVSPKVGFLRQATEHPKVDEVYYAFLGNTRRLVHPGDKVTLVFGNLSLEHVTVQ